MADTAHPTTAAQHANPKDTRPAGRLLTPELTPGVEDRRIAAELARRAAEKPQIGASSTDPPKEDSSQAVHDKKAADPQAEIERIMQCPKNSYAEILTVDVDSSEEDRLAAWRRLGCMVHFQHCKHATAKDAFKKLQKAARKMGVDQPFIDEVNLWDGEEDLQADGNFTTDEDSDAEEGGEGKMDVNEVPTPPARVIEVYQEATSLLHKLGEDPDNKVLLSQLKSLNEKIVEGNIDQNANTTNESEQIAHDQWLIPVSFFGPHYKTVLEEYAILRSDAKNQAARKRLSVTKKLIDELVKRHHFPTEWTIVSADDYLKQRDADAAAAATAASMVPEVKPTHIEYPWPTAKTANGALIVGVRQQSRWGTQVCVETVEEDGRIIRRHESASEVGLLEVEKYKTTAGHKNLTDGQSVWSSKDRSDFDELLWVTKSQTQRKNQAANSKDPPADCCVRFHKKGINILTATSLRKVLGATSANAQIDDVCKRDGIPPPWEAGFESSYEDPAKVGKDATRRRALRDAQATKSSASERQPRKQRSLSASSSGPPSHLDVNEQRLQRLEAMMVDMGEAQKTLNKTMATMAEMFERFMRLNMSSLEASSK